METYEHYFQHASINPYHPNSPNLTMRTLWQLNEQRLQWIRQLKPSGSLLDIGSGRGYFLVHAASHGYEVEGLEISPMAAQFCNNFFHIKTTIQNIEQDLHINKQFDIITLWHVLEHFSNPLNVLINLKQLLKLDGIVFVEVPNINSLKFFLSPSSKKWSGGNHPRHHRFFFSTTTLLLLFHKAGYKNIKLQTAPYSIKHHHLFKTWIKRFFKKVHLDSFITAYAALK